MVFLDRNNVPLVCRLSYLVQRGLCSSGPRCSAELLCRPLSTCRVCHSCQDLLNHPSSPADGHAVLLNRVKNFHQRSSQFEQILKKNEQMFALLALTAGLCPAATRVLDQSVLNLLQDKCARLFQLYFCWFAASAA